MNLARPVTILMADDDADDRLLTKEAFEASRLANELKFVENGVELLDYLYRRGDYVDPVSSPKPGIILLDLNMPKKDGRENAPKPTWLGAFFYSETFSFFCDRCSQMLL
jgi:CheY-like chemotaxis protein